MTIPMRLPAPVTHDGYAALLSRVRAASGEDRDLDLAVLNRFADGLFSYRWCGQAVPGCGTMNVVAVYDIPDEYMEQYPDLAEHIAFHDPKGMLPVPKFTSSLNAAVALVERALPGWAWSCGTCCGSNDGWLKPDVEGPASHLCDVFDEGFDGSAKGGNVPLAILDAMFQALIALEERAHDNG